MRTTVGLMLVGLVIAAAGCASTPAAPPSVDVSGKWAGTWSYETPSLGNGNMNGTFTQTGSNLNGNFEVTGPVVNRAANNVIGTVSGNTIKLSQPASGTLTVNGNEITGWINGLNPAKVTLKKQ